jgi:urease alpha subunit
MWIVTWKSVLGNYNLEKKYEFVHDIRDLMKKVKELKSNKFVSNLRVFRTDYEVDINDIMFLGIDSGGLL